MDAETKRCRTCEQTKPVSEFYRTATGMKGYRPSCRACTTAARRTRYAAAQDGRDASYEQLLKRDYGITLAQYEEMARRQAYRCAICRRAETVRLKRTGELKRLSVDHDHVTGAVRGLLCHRCNVLVWALEDNHTTIHAIAAYVEQFRATFAAGPPV